MNKKNIATYPVKHICVSINKPAVEVYRYASNPENSPVWTDFIKSVIKENNA